VLIQFTTGSLQDARASETWAHEHGAEYLDCAITGSANSIGTPTAHIHVSGRGSCIPKGQTGLACIGQHSGLQKEKQLDGNIKLFGGPDGIEPAERI
jgi:3-hydroxyisobutyrate dehydrogenase-like beta-hydroxyacid dehydrogenase